ncbi:MAG: PQQ-binding-like beta-propeller repeat protein [Polyangia bacterium]|nr:PQQ-binding-like beta-propeller repeat protein [Polyangia bacterium]
MSPTSSTGDWPLYAQAAWRHRLDVPPVAMHAAPDDSYLLVADVFGAVRSLDTASGQLRWERSFGMHSIHDVRATLAGAVVLLEEGRLVRLDSSTGATQWEAQVGALRSGFDATAEGGLVALSGAVHEIQGDEVRVGSEVTLWDKDGKPAGSTRLAHPVSRLRFTSSKGDLVCISPEGHVSFLKDGKVGRETQLGSSLQGLVTCLDGSLILTPAGTDGIHVLSATMHSLGVLEVSGPVEDVDVSEDGSSILVKERDGLIYLMDGRFRVRWRGRMERPLLRVDLAGDGSFAYAAEVTGDIHRFDFQAADSRRASLDVPPEAPTLSAALSFELEGSPVRQGLGRLGWLGDGAIAVLARPSQLLLCQPGQPKGRLVTLPFAAAHATPDPRSGRLALWSGRRLALATTGGALREVEGRAFSAVAFCTNGDLAVGSTSGQLRRLSASLEERWTARVGSAVLGVLPCASEDFLVVLCADGSLVKVDEQGRVVTTKELVASVLAQPDLVGDGEALEGAGAPRTDAGFWDRFGRTLAIRATPLGPLVFHGMGRVIQLDEGLSVLREAHLGLELADLRPAGDCYLAVGASGAALVLDPGLQPRGSFTLGSIGARPASRGSQTVIFDATEEAALLRSLDGAILRQAELYPAPRALAVSPDGARGATLLDTRLLVFDLDG